MKKFLVPAASAGLALISLCLLVVGNHKPSEEESQSLSLASGASEALEKNGDAAGDKRPEQDRSLTLEKEATEVEFGTDSTGSGMDEQSESAATLAMNPEDRKILHERKAFSDLAPEEMFLSRADFSRLFASKKGDEIRLKLGREVSGIVKTNHIHPGGARAFNVELGELGGAYFSVVEHPSGRISGRILQNGNPDGFSIEGAPEASAIAVKATRTDQLVCAWPDKNGGVTMGHIRAKKELEAAGAESEAVTAAMIPDLQSRPGSSRVIYLDFDGEVVENTSWLNGDRIDAQPYQYPSRIPGIFRQIAEDFDPFNVNVTTTRSVFDAAPVGSRCMAIFTPTDDAGPGTGGYAFYNTVGDPVNYMCWVYNSSEQAAGDTGSHEVGHQMGLFHDGRTEDEDGDPETYYNGHTHATGPRWGPIMGAAFGRNITHWSQGDYQDANNQQDDFDFIVDDFPYLADDHGNARGSATNITTSAAMTFSTGGRIGRTGDYDYFRLVVNKAGDVTASASPTEDTWRNLDVGLRLENSAGTVIASSEPNGPFTASLSATDLAVGTYYLRVRGTGLGSTTWAENGYDNYCSLGSFTLTGTYPFLLTPNTPTNLTATDGTSTDNVFLNWNSTPDTDGYRVYRNDFDDPLTATEIADVSTTSYTDTTALHNVIYYYWVVSYNNAGGSDFSDTDTGFRRLPPPDTPTGLTATDGSSTQWVRLNWAIANFAYEYEVYRNTVNSTSGGTLLTTVTSPTRAFDDTTGAAGVTYYYYVRAKNPEATSGYSNVNPGFKRIPPPAAPTGVSATDGSSPTETTISWSAAALAAGYYVYRNTTNSSNGALVVGGTTSELSFTDTSGTAGSVYYYFVRAYNEDGFSGFSSGDSGFRQAVPPVAPSSVEASQGEFAENVRIAWDATADTVDYQIFRNDENSTAGLRLLGTQAGRVFYDNEADPGRTYFYFIRSRNGVGSSPYSTAAIGFVGDEDPSDDAYENNDTRLTAYSFKANEGEWLSEEDGPAVANDRDWFEIKTESDTERLDVVVTYTGTPGELTVDLYDATGSMVASGSEGADAKVIAFDLPDSDSSYYVVVYDAAGSGTEYDLRWHALGTGESGVSVDSAVGLHPARKRGEGIVNASAGGQTVSSVSRSRAIRRSYFSGTNDSSLPDTVQVRGTRGNRLFRVVYYENTNGVRSNVTGQIYGGTETTDLLPQGRADYQVLVRPHGRLTRYRTVRLYLKFVTWSTIDPSASDANRFHVTKIREPRRRRPRGRGRGRR